jgi:VWFA-related protein
MLGLVLATAVATIAQEPQTPPAATPGVPVFRSKVDLVSVAAVVRDRRGHVVRDLARDDFQIFEDGRPRRIVEFAPAEDGPVSVALLVDVSGSMAVGDNLNAGRQAINHLMAWMRRGQDEVALFTFDSRLRSRQEFTTDPEQILRSLSSLGAFGVTSLYDAIGETAQKLGQRSTRRRAIIVLTDGLDNNSRQSAAEVSSIASATDVPVYVVAVVSPLDHKQAAAVAEGQVSTGAGSLANLAWWTGGNYYVVSTAAQASVSARQLLAELRHQYVLAFESSGATGWKPLDIRMRRPELTVRARSGYFSRERPNG